MKTTFTLLFSFLTITAFAQQNFVPGYYITSQGEKVEAQINDQNWDKNPTFIEVTTDANAGIQKLSVSDIKGFSLSSGDMYESFIVDIDKSPTKLDEIQIGSQPLIVRDTVFLKAVVKGAASLYYLKDENAKVHYFLKKGEEVPGELFYRTVKFQTENKTGFTKQPIYRGLLKAQLTGCPEIAEKFTNLSFNQKSLKAVVASYNQCVSGSDGEYVVTEEKLKWNVVALGGLTYTNMKFSSTENDALTGQDFTDLSPTAGVSLLVTLPRNNGKWGIQSDLMYKSFQAEGSYTTGSATSGQTYTKTDTEFNMGYIGLNTSVRYRLLDGKLKPYISAGIANNLMVSDNSKQQVYRKYYTSESRTEKAPLEDVRKYEQAVLVGVGVVLNRIVAEIKFENGNGFSAYTGLKSARKSFSLQLGYTLK